MRKKNEAHPTSDPNKAMPLNGNGNPKKPAISGANFSGVKDFKDVPPPDESWKAQQLGQYARAQNKEIILGERKLAIHVYRLGQALTLAKKKTKHGQWAAFLKEYGISSATWIRVKQLVERASEAALLKLGLTEAYIKFGILSQPEIPVEDDEGKPSEEGGKKKGGKNSAKACKGSKQKPPAKRVAKTAANKSPDNGEQPDEEKELDPWAVLDDFSKRNRWNNQRQVQAMVDYWGPDVLNVLVRDVGDETDFKEFLADQEKMPPPKGGDSPLGVMVMLRNRITLMVSEIKTVDWAKESASDYRQRLDEIVVAVEQLRKEVPHE